jgi:predicted transglutaminase-like cysteine proteinase
LSARFALLRVLMVAVAAALCSMPSVAQDNQVNRNDNRLYTVPVEPAQTPQQWRDFCDRHPRDCEPDALGEARIILMPEAWRELAAINTWVNASIKPQTDEEHWQVEDRWDYPDDGFGDCEDFALLKRRLLIESGFPAGALMLTVVWTKQKNGHAVLLVRTDRGEFVLDSENPQVRHWTETGYRFVKRQRSGNPNEWVYIDGDSQYPTAVSWSSGSAAK